MADLAKQVKTALDETRTLILGVEILVGFDYQSVLQTRFESLSPVAHVLRVFGLGMLLLCFGLQIAPGAHHRVVEHGNDSPDLLRFTTRVAGLSLLPFALGIAADILIALETVAGVTLSVVGGLVVLALALFFWYGLELLDRRRYGRPYREEPMAGETPLHEKIEQVMTEGRIVLPGVQAILGFQLAAFLMNGFEPLPHELKMLHLASLGFVAVSVILLMTPPAYHRIVEHGEDSEHLLRFSSRMLLAAMAFLAPGLSGDFYLVVDRATHSPPTALACAVAALALFYGLWFGYTAYRRSRAAGNQSRQPAR